MGVAICPPSEDLQRLFLGGLPESAVEALEAHVLECRSCLEQLKRLYQTRETLAGVLSGETSCGDLASSPLVADLMKKLESLRPASSPNQGASMITFPCAHCQKQLKVKEALAGKKIKCPGCGQVTVAAARAAVAAGANEDMATLPPAAVLETSSQQTSSGPPLQAEKSTNPPASQADATQAPDSPHPGHDAGLTDFLAPPQADDELGRLGKYRILKILGHGGMGVVFKAEDARLKRSVAIKAMLPALAASASAGKRFLREAQATAAVEHDHIVRIHQVDEDRGVPYLVMEFLKGEPLDERLKREPKLALPEVLRIGREIAEALGAAHATGLIHRDIKPANIWLEAPRNRVKILDFGLARAVAEDSGLTQQGAVIGTPAYMAPEQGRGDPVDGRTDLFSLGVVLYRLTSGQQPFLGKDTVSTLMEVAMHEPAAPIQVNPDLPRDLSDLVMKLLEKDPARRLASAGEAVEALQAMEKRIGQAEPDTLAAAAPPFRRGAAALPRPGSARTPQRSLRRPSVVVALAAAALALLAAGIVLFWQTPTGTVRIEINDPNIKVVLDKDGLAISGADKQDIQLAPGEHGLHVKRGGLEFDTDRFLLKKGETINLKVEWLKEGKIQVLQGDKVIGSKSDTKLAGAAVAEAWLKEVAALSTAKQVAAVKAKLQELNPGFDGRVQDKVAGGAVIELRFDTDKITDLSPVRALAGLRTLHCGSFYRGGRRSKFEDLSQLKGMKLTSLDCSGCIILNDLSPLKEMKLTTLHFTDTPVADLSPLKDMPLTELIFNVTRVSDLAPLKNMKLTSLECNSTEVRDLAPLKGMPLTALNVGSTKVTDLSPLKDMPLTSLSCERTNVADLAPLKGMKLTSLFCNNTPVTDLTPLKGTNLQILHCDHIPAADLSPLKELPLRELNCDFNAKRDTAILRSIKTLEKINGKPATQFWKELDAGTPNKR